MTNYEFNSYFPFRKIREEDVIKTEKIGESNSKIITIVKIRGDNITNNT